MPKSATFERLATTREESSSEEEEHHEEGSKSERRSCTSVPSTSYNGVKRVYSGASAGRIFGRENGGPMDIVRSFFGFKR